MTDVERDELIEHYKRAIHRVRIFRVAHRKQITQRQDSMFRWVDCTWAELCMEAIGHYMRLIKELKDGVYKPSGVYVWGKTEENL